MRSMVAAVPEAEADIAVEVAIGDMVHHLADGPAARAIWGIELLPGESLDRRAELRGGSLNLADPLRTHLRSDGFRALEPSDGVT